MLDQSSQNYAVSVDVLSNESLKYTLMIAVVHVLLLNVWLPLHALNTTKHSKHFPTGIQTLHTMRSDHFSETYHSQPTANNYIHISCSLD
jgi:hypothetical protein